MAMALPEDAESRLGEVTAAMAFPADAAGTLGEVKGGHGVPSGGEAGRGTRGRGLVLTIRGMLLAMMDTPYAREPNGGSLPSPWTAASMLIVVRDRKSVV